MVPSPTNPSPLTKSAEYPATAAGAISGVSPTDAPGAAPLRILVLDDDRDTADSMAMLLQVLGHTVQTAYDGPQALAAAGAFCPQVAVLDLALPGLDGLEVARRLRALPGLDGLRLIALSGYTQPEHRLRSAEAGFAVHLAKPCSAEDLQRALVMVAEVC
jgi:CheY-like chemotaxis protein